MAADPKTSAGARAERKAFRDYLRRQGATSPEQLEESGNVLNVVLKWVLDRQKRYDKKKGGLGR